MSAQIFGDAAVSVGVDNILLLGIALATAAGLVIVYLPRRITRSLWERANDDGKIDYDKVILAENSVRGTLSAVATGFFFLITSYYTAKQLSITYEGQLTDRFTRAVEQISVSSDSSTLPKRVGGIFALERIARDSSCDHWAVMEVLLSYVREHGAWSDAARDRTNPAADVQAAMKVFCRRNINNDPEISGSRLAGHLRVDLKNVDLRYMNLAGANLEGVDLTGAHLERAILRGAKLNETSLAGAHLDGADLMAAELQGADLKNASFIGANLAEVKNLSGALIKGTHFEFSYLVLSDISQATFDWNKGPSFFYGATLNGCRISEGNLADMDGLTKEQLSFATIVKLPEAQLSNLRALGVKVREPRFEIPPKGESFAVHRVANELPVEVAAMALVYCPVDQRERILSNLSTRKPERANALRQVVQSLTSLPTETKSNVPRPWR
jgi:uncharacterized protein YjbI with pentapeptide repeats